jgi:preprotein translocase subunit SecA
MFKDMMTGIRYEAVQFLFNVEIKQNLPEVQATPVQSLTYSAPAEQGGVDTHDEKTQRSRPVPPVAKKPPQVGPGSAFFRG